MSESRANNNTEQLFTESGTEITDAERDLFLEQIAAAFASPQEDVPLTHDVYPEPTAPLYLSSTEPELPLFIEIGFGINSRRTFMLVGGADGLYVHVCKDHEDLVYTMSLYNGAVPAYDPIYYDHGLNAIFFNPNDYETIRTYKPNFIIVDKDIYNLESKQKNALRERYNDQIYMKSLEEYCKQKKSELVEISMSTSIHSFFQTPQPTINTQIVSTSFNDDEVQTTRTVNIANPTFRNINIEQEQPFPFLIELGVNNPRSFALINGVYVHVCAKNENPLIIARNYNSSYKSKKDYRNLFFIARMNFERTVFLTLKAYPVLKAAGRIRVISADEEYARICALRDLYENADYCKKLENLNRKKLENFEPESSGPSSKKARQKITDDPIELAKTRSRYIIRLFEKEEENRRLKRKR